MVTRRKVRTAVQDHVDALRSDGHLDTQGEALASIALALAAQIDAGDPPASTAPCAKELRAVLAQLEPEGDDDDGDPDGWLDTLGGGGPEVRHAP